MAILSRDQVSNFLMKFPKQAKHAWSEENFSTSSFRGRFGVAEYTDRLDS